MDGARARVRVRMGTTGSKRARRVKDIIVGGGEVGILEGVLL